MLLLLNVCCDPSLEPFHRDGSNEGLQHMFLLRNKQDLSQGQDSSPDSALPIT